MADASLAPAEDGSGWGGPQWSMEEAAQQMKELTRVHRANAWQLLRPRSLIHPGGYVEGGGTGNRLENENYEDAGEASPGDVSGAHDSDLLDL